MHTSTAHSGIVLDEDQAAQLVGDDTLAWFHATIGPFYTWSVYVVGADKVHTHANPDLDGDDDENAEFTQRTALKFAADATSDPDDQAGQVHAIVLHHGEPWTLREWDGPADAYCEWFDYDECDFFCNQCFRPLSGHNTPCPEHAPVNIPGLQVTECGQPEEHPRSFVYADNGGYGAPCMYCVHASMKEAHEGCEHARHLFWFRWHRVVRALKRLRIVRSFYYTSGCRCAPVTAWAWTKRVSQ